MAAIAISVGTLVAAWLGPEFAVRTADEWEAFLLPREIACVRADAASHVRFLHTDPQTAAIQFRHQSRDERRLAVVLAANDMDAAQRK